MTLDLWLLYLLAAVGLSLTPGPNGLLSLTHGARFGVRATVWTVSGGAVGFLLLIAVSLAGMGTLLAASERAFTVAKWAGAAYLVWLGVRLWRAPPAFANLTTTPVPLLIAAGRPGRLFGEGFMVAASNPKALVFFAAFLPQFMVADAARSVPFVEQLAVFGGTFVAVEVAYELLLAAMAQRIAPRLARWGRWFNRGAGATFIGIGALLTTASR